MPRRHREDGQPVESDSFLDVVANIVGILIILIVIVGVRVGQDAAAPDPVEPVVAAPAVVPVVAPRPKIIRIPAVVPVAPERSPQLLASLDAAAIDAEHLERERRRLATEIDRTGVELAAVGAGAEGAAAAQVELASRLAASDRDASALAVEIDDLRSTLAGLGRQVSDTPAEKVTVLEHKLNPIGREVVGKELHFRLAEGRVSQVPVDDLVERLKPEIERRKDWIIRYRRHQGTIGPVDAYTMEYVVERQRLGVVEELRHGAMMMRIGVTGWRMTPGPGLVAESGDEALRSDSRFVTALRLAEPDATLTFWTYPDSFPLYRRLQKFAHDEGFEVAARPLPHGVPIAGSPKGSRSSSQ